MTPSKILFYFCLSFIGGIFLNSIINLDIACPNFLFSLFFGICFISVFCIKIWTSHVQKIVVFGFCILFLVAGAWRHQMVVLKIANNELKDYWGQNITLTGIVDAEPDRREKTTKLTIKVQNLDERVLITRWHYPEYEYGDKLKITGQLEEPQIFDEREEDTPSSSPFAIAREFNYKEYLAKDRIFALVYQPKIELIEKNRANSLKFFLISIKNKLKESLNKAMSFPQSAILEALLFGDEGSIPKLFKEKLNLTGTRHIAAVSGMNITILTFLLSDFLLISGFYRSQAFYFSMVLIFLYILMIGAPASAIRAGIMATLFLIAQYFGRISAGSRAIIFTATCMLFSNPLLLISDVGFQLSFLAVMGLIYLQPTLFAFFKALPDILQLRYNLSGTLAAQIFTLPLLIYNFGQISIISPLANILILPLLPPVTILGFIFAVVGIFWEILGQTLSWPAWFLLTYLTRVVDFFSKILWATLTFKNIHCIWLLISYLILGLLVWRLQESQKLKFLKY